MAYKTTCPKCKAEDSLRVTSGVFMAMGMPLSSDGFSFSEAKQVDTEDERCVCVDCEAKFQLTELMDD